MSATLSDYEMSDSSSSGVSSANSPMNTLPQLTADLTELSCAGNNREYQLLTNKPFLEIIEQPQDQFRFRYVSELMGTHGCLLGKLSVNNDRKTYPSVQLVNYAGEAELKCNLIQDNNTDEHPHKLHENDEGRDVSHIVPEEGSYMVAFRGMGIIHTAKKELQKKYKDKLKHMNLNIVRLKFSAYDVQTGEEICAPVYSEPIHNLKSAATNDLKICRISRTSGRASGGDDIFIFVEKVNKKHVEIHFFELDGTGKRIWDKPGYFMPNDVHHQYAIAFRTPPYRDPETPTDVKVYMELLRTTDGRTSDAKEFKYKADEMRKQLKRRKTNTSYSFNCTSPNNFKSEIPAAASVSPRNTNQIPVSVFNQQVSPVEQGIFDVPVPFSLGSFNEPQVSPAEQGISEVPVAYSMGSFNENLYASSPSQCDVSSVSAISETSYSPSDPMWGQNNDVALNGDPALSSAHLENMQNIDPHEFAEEMTDFALQYMKGYNEAFPEERVYNTPVFQLPSSSSSVVPDSGRGSHINFEAGEEDNRLGPQMSVTPDFVVINKNNIEYKAFYKAQDGIEVKKLIKELCEIIRDKKGFKKQDIRKRLEKLLDIRLSNGDTFLHMSLFSDQTCLEYIAKMIHSVKATHLLDYCNDKLQTTLHLAVLHNIPHIVTSLVSKGADPMLKDYRELNAIHYAVKVGSCLKPLLEAIKNNNVVCNINECNSENQSALHMAVLEDSGSSARALLQHGASYSVRDECGRTPLHLAAYDDRLDVTKTVIQYIPAHGASYSVRDECGRTPLHLAAYDDRLDVTKTLIQYIPASDIDATDNAGNTALQIVCGVEMRENTITIARLLLENKANPMKSENGNSSAWKLVKNKPALKAVLWDYVSSEFRDEDANDDDVFLSADEGEEEQAWRELSVNSETPAMTEEINEASAAKRDVI